ncbi:MAG: PQQ-binding-like beta-propeller repeat protein, partial [Phycisphaerales bacterium]|nr:PQQ-binding-like beta-propeller repeat protein [Phycisphaerales bacterium]
MPRSLIIDVVVLGLATGGVAAAAAQAPDDGRAPAATATLPESNEALLISSRIRTALQNQDFALAFRLLEGYPAGSSELVAIPASETYQPVWREAWRLYGETPPAGVELYRRLREEAARVRYEEASRNADIATLRTLFRTERLCEVWPRIARDFATLLLESGHYSEAIEALRLLQREQPRAADVQAQLAVTLALAGADDAARRALGDDTGDVRFEAVREWLARFAGDSGEGIAPLLNAPADWSAETPTPTYVDIDDTTAIAKEVEYWRRMPLIEPTVGGGALVFRLRGELYAYDALTLLPRWIARELTGNPTSADSADFHNWGPAEMPGWSATLSEDTRALLTAHLQHTLAADDHAVYTIEALFTSAPDMGILRRPRPDAQSNELIARRLSDGAVLWRVKAESVVSGRVAAFLDRPVIDGDRLVLPARSDGDIALVALSAETGAVVRQMSLVGPPTRLPDMGGYCLMTADQSHLYVATGNGVVAAVGRDDLDWRWATTYESALSDQLTVRWAPTPIADDGPVDRPVLAGDMLVVAPVDSRRRSPEIGETSEVLFIDRFEGRLRWRIPRQDIAFLVGGATAGLIVGGPTIRCLSLSDPSGPPAWETPPLRISGRPALSGDRVYVPTREGLVVVDATNGRIFADQRYAQTSGEARLDEALPEGLDRAAANVIATPQGLYVVSPDRVIKYADPVGVSDAVTRRSAAGPDSADLAYARAWLRLLRADEQGVLEELGSAPESGDPLLASASARLRVNALLRLSRQASTDEERLRWLREAAEAGEGTRSGEAAIALGDALEQAGRIDDAIRHYLQVVILATPDLVGEPGHGNASVAPWIIAARRLRDLSDSAVVDVKESLEDSPATPAQLMRLLEA